MKGKVEKSSWVIVLLLVALFSIPALSFAATANAPANSVVSTSIKPADGTTGQTLTTGSGVKTGHIQDGAITTTKVLDSAVTTAKLGAAAVTSAKIANAAVTNALIADGAITDAKISGTISAAKISSTGLNADTVDGKHAADFAATAHNHDVTYQKKYANVIVVAKSGGDFTDPVAAMNSITDATASNPYLLKIMPGVYDLGTNRLNVKDFVSMEGSGRLATILKSTADVMMVVANATTEISKIGLDFTLISHVNNTVQAIEIDGNGSAKMSDVTLSIGGTQPMNSYYAIMVLGGKLDANSVTIVSNQTTSGGAVGVYADLDAVVVMNNCNITLNNSGVSSGMMIEGGTYATIKNSSFEVSQGAGIRADGPTTVVRAYNSRCKGYTGFSSGEGPFFGVGLEILSSIQNGFPQYNFDPLHKPQLLNCYFGDTLTVIVP